MGILDIFRNQKQEPDEVTKKAKEIAKKTIKQQLYRFNKEISTWKMGVDSFEDSYNSTNDTIISVYNDIVIDSHLSAAIETRITKTTSKEYKIVDENKEETEETEIFESQWFRDFMRLALESKFYGYSLIQFGDRTENGFACVEVVPREYVYPQKYGVRKSPQSTTELIPFTTGQYKNWLIGVGKPKDIGLLMKAAPLVIYKNTAFGSWSEFTELFGSPFRFGKTNVRDEALRDNMYDMLENMGRNAFGVFHTDDELEYIKDSQTDSYQVFNELIERANSEISKLVLGSTMTMDDGSSRSQSEVHERTTGSIEKEDALFLAEVVNKQLIPFLNAYQGFDIKGKWVFDDSENTPKAEQFKIDIELVKNGYNVPKEYFTETYGTPIDEVEETEAEAVEVNNQLKKKLFSFENYEIFTRGESCEHEVCNTIDLSDTPEPTWSQTFINEILTGVHAGVYTLSKLPESLYLKTADKLVKSMLEGVAESQVIPTIADPNFIRAMRNNAYVFSGAKTFQEVKTMSDFLIDENGEFRSFADFKKKAEVTFDQFNKTWLRTEMTQAHNTAEAASKWQEFESEKEVFPMLRYDTAGDERVRSSHKKLDGIIKPVDDPFWDVHAPPNGWNCRCELLQESEAVPTPDDEIPEPDDIPESMRFNPGKQKVLFSPEHPYFQVGPQFEDLMKNNFNLPDPPEFVAPEVKSKLINIDKKVETAKAKLKKVKSAPQRERQIFNDLEVTREEMDNIWSEEEALKGYVDEAAMVRINARQKKLKIKEGDLIDSLATINDDLAEDVFNILKQDVSADFKNLKGDISKLSGARIDKGVKYFKGIIGNKKKIQGKKVMTLQTTDPIGGRAFMSKKYLKPDEKIGTINLSQRDGIDTITHELGHWLEMEDPVYFKKITDFYERRTQKDPFKQLKNIHPKAGYRANEITKEDDFMSAYTGKFYGKKQGGKIIRQDATEITSMWFTEVFKDPAKFIELDEDMFNFVYKSLLE